MPLGIHSFMLYDITVTRQKKIQNSTATVGRPPESMERVFSTATSANIGTDHILIQQWSSEEEQYCLECMAIDSEQNPSSTL